MYSFDFQPKPHLRYLIKDMLRIVVISNAKKFKNIETERKLEYSCKKFVYKLNGTHNCIVSLHANASHTIRTVFSIWDDP